MCEHIIEPGIVHSHSDSKNNTMSPEIFGKKSKSKNVHARHSLIFKVVVHNEAEVANVNTHVAPWVQLAATLARFWHRHWIDSHLHLGVGRHADEVAFGARVIAGELRRCRCGILHGLPSDNTLSAIALSLFPPHIQPYSVLHTQHGRLRPLEKGTWVLTRIKGDLIAAVNADKVGVERHKGQREHSTRRHLVGKCERIQEVSRRRQVKTTEAE